MAGNGHVIAEPKPPLRGVFLTEYPARARAVLQFPDMWVVGYMIHSATPPIYDRLADIFLVSPFWKATPTPRHLTAFVTAFDFICPEQYRPLNIPKTHDVIFNATWWCSIKRHQLMLDALTYARDRGRPISCLWYGYHWTPDSHDCERATKECATSRNLPITFLEPDWSFEENNRRFNCCRAAVLCSKTEAGPRVLTEAMLAGLPYITTVDTFGGSPAIVLPSTGHTCSPTPEAIAETIWYVLDNLNQYRPREWALAHACRPHGLQKVKTVLEALAATRGWQINMDIDYYGQTGQDWVGYITALEAKYGGQ